MEMLGIKRRKKCLHGLTGRVETLTNPNQDSLMIQIEYGNTHC